MTLSSSPWWKLQTLHPNTWGPTWRPLCSSVWKWVKSKLNVFRCIFVELFCFKCFSLTKPLFTKCHVCLAVCWHQPDKHAAATGTGGHRHPIGDCGSHAEKTHSDRGSERWEFGQPLFYPALLVYILSTQSSCVKWVRQYQYLFVLYSVPQMLAMMVDLEDDDEWAMADELEDDDFDR